MNKQLRELFKTDDPCATCNFRDQSTYNEPCISCSELENGEESNHCLDEEIEKVVEELEAKAQLYENAKEDIELATAVKAWFNQINWYSSFAADMGMASKRKKSISDLLNWYREEIED